MSGIATSQQLAPSLTGLRIPPAETNAEWTPLGRAPTAKQDWQFGRSIFQPTTEPEQPNGVGGDTVQGTTDAVNSGTR